MATTNWKTLADKMKADGYTAGSWEAMLRKAVERANPDLVKELGTDYPFWAIVRTQQARNLYHRLMDEGTPAQDARNLALDELLENGAARADDRLETTPEFA